MKIEIKYTDIDDNPLSPERLDETHNFKKHTYIDGVLKMIEKTYRSRNARRTSYFLDDATESIDVIVNKLCNSIENAACNIHFNKTVKNGFTLWDCQDYNIYGLPIGVPDQVVFDTNKRIIYYNDHNRETGVLERVCKKLYANESENANEDVLFDIIFSLNPETGQIEFDNIRDSNLRFPSHMPKDFDIDFLKDEGIWDKHPYYRSHLPILPETEEI